MSLEIQLKNVGQVASGRFGVGGFTLFVGPNNSGKSVAAICAYAATNMARPINLFSPPIVKRKDDREYLDQPQEAASADEKFVEDFLLQLLESDFDDDHLKSLKVPRRVQAFVNRYAAEALRLYGSRVADEVERCFGTRLDAVARRQTEAKSEIRIRGSFWSWSIAIDFRAAGDEQVRVDRLPHVRDLALDALRAWSRSFNRGSVSRHALIPDFSWLIVYLLLRREVTGSSEYLPAERAGILQGHRLLASAVLRRAPYVGIERLDMPQMSGVITDFLSNILQIDEEEDQPDGTYDAAAAWLEKSVLDGKITIARKDQGYPEIQFVQGKTSFPLHRVSSMVTEVAPIVLYLRHRLTPGDLLIIEEPESHLHPKNQIRVAESLTGLFSERLNLLVTTHSDYFLAALSNALRREPLPSQDGHRSLRPADLTAFVFVPSRRGTVMEPLDVSVENGIDEEEFGRVTEQLYEATAELEQKLHSQQ